MIDGEVLRSALLRAGISQSEAARRCGVSRQMINNTIHGRYVLQMDTALQLAALLRIRIEIADDERVLFTGRVTGTVRVRLL
jgi:plasmid maintenance system antidote protein VapI